MNEMNLLPEISDGARELLRISMENDRYGAIARNAALLAGFNWLARLRTTAQNESRAGQQRLFEAPKAPKTFLELACATIMSIQSDLDSLYMGQNKGDEPLVTDFNRHAFQALAETLADETWPDRRAQDFDGPPAEQVFQRLNKKSVDGIWVSYLRNYLGNILQDCFAAARIRESVPDLDAATELNLRLEDSDKIAHFVMQSAKRKSANPESRLLITELKAVLEAIVKESRES